MEPITSITIASYVSLKFLDQFTKEEGYGRIKNFLFPKRKYKNQLIKIILETIKEFHQHYPERNDRSKFYFFQSQIIFEELNKYLLFAKQTINYEDLLCRFQENHSIIVPTNEELEFFYDRFTSKIKEDKKLKSLFFDENYKAKIFKITEKLNDIEVKVDDILEKVTVLKSSLSFIPDEAWFKNQCEKSILVLGKRYTPKLNFILEVSRIFDALGRTSNFKKSIADNVDELLIKGRKVLKKKEEVKAEIELLEQKFDEIYQLFSTIDLENNEKIAFTDFIIILDSIEEITHKLKQYYNHEEHKLQKEKNDFSHYHKYGTELRNLRDFESNIYNFRDFIEDGLCETANNPYLILEGEAGIGKSHMLGDIVTKRIKNNYESVFLLGQQFTTEDNQWSQIFNWLQIKNTTSEEFLNIINDRAKKTKKRIIIFIDAVNEGRGKYIWPENIKSFISEVKKYEYLGLVLSVRSSYKDLIFPKESIKELELIENKLHGFRNDAYDACKLFFSNYKIQLPNIPLLHPEFHNPLFLKLFCEGISKSGQNKIPDGVQGISSIINFFIKNVNAVLADSKRFDYSTGINLVDRCVEAVVRYKLDNELRYVNYEKAIEIVEDIVSKFVTKKGTFLDELISEGIFAKNLFWIDKDTYEEGIYLAYERFEDHLTCKYLLNTDLDLEAEFKEGGSFYKYIEDEDALYFNKGLIDAFSIQIPEKINREFYELIPHLTNEYTIADSFVESLLWRKHETINENSAGYINEVVFSYDETHDLFWETTISITSVPEHFYNAYSLNNHLSGLSMANRDASWTRILKDKFKDDSSFKRLIDWAWNQEEKLHISDESIKLTSITLAWFHTSTNRELRDSSTKALINLLQNRIDVLIEVLKIFEKVNDPSVYERLFAVAYGCSLRTRQIEKLTDLSEYIYETIFNKKDEVYPHILLRDYARGVIEYTYSLKMNLSFDIMDVKPPYKSNFPETILSNEELDELYKFDYESPNFKKIYWSQNEILSSMTTEYGRGTGGYGDFGRYTFQSALRTWDVNPNDLSNIAVEWIFKKYGYDVDKHGGYDNNLEYNGRKAATIERIGKKYQWLALYEILARVSDNFKKFERWANDEKEEPYQGPWNPYVRDIDPTILIKATATYQEDEKKEYWWTSKDEFNWDCSFEDWIKKTDNLPVIENLISLNDTDGNEWLVLEGHPEWAEEKKIGQEKWDNQHKRMWCQIRSYILEEKDFENFTSWSMNQDFTGRWMPENREKYEVFNREYYWSQAYKDICFEDNDDYKRDIHDRKTGKLVSEVVIPVETYMWEEEFDKSKEETITFMKPSVGIFEGMGLQYSNKEGEFLDSNGDLICFDTSVNNNSRAIFLIKKEPFLKYLEENNLRIAWTILGEKQVIGGSTFGKEYLGMLEFSGAYYIKENELFGNLKTKQR
ncbi:AVAST type 2 anti-phage system protein Avs2 [Flavobacterium poyangense]|uniref:AVAST type 2 anti-phage system protein Avs2 n=1 Tax=Flavobacterium poyangense TaxID=2204302 RepID=UPI0014225E28|nr:AVAST type 2 anti-phage system protein Avs2 [Flavobacterium sp. JXAS1]